MEIETKLIKTHKENDDIKDAESIEKELDHAMKKHERVKKMIDIFFLGLFIVFIIYTII
jgi:hypothetical protein